MNPLRSWYCVKNWEKGSVWGPLFFSRRFGEGRKEEFSSFLVGDQRLSKL